MSLDAMKQALAMLEEIADEVFSPYDNKLGDAILALRAAIKEAEKQEPVAWYFVRDLEKGISFAPDSDSTKSWQPLYTAPLMATEPVAWMHPSWIDPDTRGWASFMGFGEEPIKMEGGIADPDAFVWECNCQDCQVRYKEWKAAFDMEQKELRERNT